MSARKKLEKNRQFRRKSGKCNMRINRKSDEIFAWPFLENKKLTSRECLINRTLLKILINYSEVFISTTYLYICLLRN